LSVADHTNVLSTLQGEWTGQETIAASKWGPGGLAISRVSSRFELGGRILVQVYEAVRDGSPWLSAHAVFTYDEESGEYGLYWFDSLGFAPLERAAGHWNGTALEFIRRSPRGISRQSYVPGEPGSYGLTLESSFDQGATWIPVMNGNYLRSGGN